MYKAEAIVTNDETNGSRGFLVYGEGDTLEAAKKDLQEKVMSYIHIFRIWDPKGVGVVTDYGLPYDDMM